MSDARGFDTTLRNSAPVLPGLMGTLPLLYLDTSVSALYKKMFDRARFSLKKAAVKLHLVLDHNGHLRPYVVIAESKKHEVSVRLQIQFASQHRDWR